MSPSTSRLEALATAVAQRLRLAEAWRAGAIGVALAAVFAGRRVFMVPLVAPTSGVPWGDVVALLLLAALGAAIGYARTVTSHARVGAAIEAAVPSSKNLLFTALELARSASTPDAPAAHTVLARADAMAAAVDARTVVPVQRAQRRAFAMLGVWAAVLLLVTLLPTGAATRTAARTVAAVGGAATVSRVDVRIAPPAYARLAPAATRDPQRVEALEGSELAFTIASGADSLRLETPDSAVTLARPAQGDFVWHTRLQRDGFVSLTPWGRRAGARRLIALSMQRDAAPTVRVVAPGKDLILPSADRTLDVRIDASDDVAMATLQLHYTKVSGSGERFSFEEGTVPVQVARTSRTQWSARAALALKPLLTEPGDLVVYRARATDARPGRDPIESDAFIAQLAEAGGVAALGFSMDPDEDRYAVSQQMVIQKTERLLAAQKTLPLDTVGERAAQIAVEQRRVRAEFVFMTGGEFEAGVVETEEGGTQLDEAAEADAESDLAAGRMVNRGRQALLTAIRSMSRASVALTEKRLADALRLEKVALTNLQEAFARQRFLMRALTQREALDPARRHTGSLDSLARAVAPTTAPERDAARDALRAVLARLVAVPSGRAAPSLLTEAAMQVLQVNAADRGAQQIAQWLTQASTRPRDARVLSDSAATALAQWIARATPPGTTPPRAIGQWRAQQQRDALARARAGGGASR